MTVNKYVKQWCNEEYDVRKEDFYVENAFYVAEREWANGGFKHGMIALAITFLSPLVGGNNMLEAILNACMFIGALTICFWVYGIREYDANSCETSKPIYIMTFLALLILKNRTPVVLHWLFAIASMVLYVYLTLVRPIKFRAVAEKMKQRILKEEEEAEEASKKSYAQWEANFKYQRYGLPSGNVDGEDPMIMEARGFFDGYTTDKHVLKSRYRQLMKAHHPDRGGNEKLCQCIIAVYEELSKKFE